MPIVRSREIPTVTPFPLNDKKEDNYTHAPKCFSSVMLSETKCSLNIRRSEMRLSARSFAKLRMT